MLSEALSLMSVEDVCLGLLQPVLNEIGRRWHAGEASVAQEHFATGLVRARLLTLLQHALAGVDHPAILAACPPGEWHELGLIMICLFLARRGYTVGYLGANLPAEELARVVQDSAPRLVLLSAQTDATAEALGEVLRSLRRLPPPGPSWHTAAGSSTSARSCARARRACTWERMRERRSRASNGCWAAVIGSRMAVDVHK